MNTQKQTLLGSTLLAAVLAFSFSSPAMSIAKCKDVNGKWHYGDNVEHLCKRSKVTKLTNRGFIQQEVAAEKTPEQIAAEEEKLLAEQKRMKAEELDKIISENERIRILGSYESESDISKVSKEKVKAYEKRKAQYSEYLNYLNKRKAMLSNRRQNTKSKNLISKLDQDIAKVNAEIADSEKDKSKVDAIIEKVTKEFERELMLYKKFVAEENAAN